MMTEKLAAYKDVCATVYHLNGAINGRFIYEDTTTKNGLNGFSLTRKAPVCQTGDLTRQMKTYDKIDANVKIQTAINTTVFKLYKPKGLILLVRCHLFMIKCLRGTIRRMNFSCICGSQSNKDHNV